MTLCLQNEQDMLQATIYSVGVRVGIVLELSASIQILSKSLQLFLSGPTR